MDILLTDVLFVPKIKNKLLSLSAVIQKGVEVHFCDDKCIFTVKNKDYGVGHKHGKLYKLNIYPVESCYGSRTASVVDSVSLWHKQYGHLGYDNLKLLSDKGMVTGMKFDTSFPVPDKPCESCVMGKQKRLPFSKKSISNSSNPLELVHSDVCGPMSVDSVGGSKYFVTFIDDFSHFIVVYMMKHKSEVFQKFKFFLSMGETLLGKRMLKSRSDNGGECTSDEYRSFLKERGIKKDETVPYSPQQNGLAERTNRTIMEKVRSMLYGSKLPFKFWAEAVSTAVYLQNRSPTNYLGDITPYEKWYQNKPNVGHLRVFGCVAYAHIPSAKRSKLDVKSRKCIFV